MQGKLLLGCVSGTSEDPRWIRVSVWGLYCPPYETCLGGGPWSAQWTLLGTVTQGFYQSVDRDSCTVPKGTPDPPSRNLSACHNWARCVSSTVPSFQYSRWWECMTPFFQLHVSHKVIHVLREQCRHVAWAEQTLRTYLCPMERMPEREWESGWSPGVGAPLCLG